MKKLFKAFLGIFILAVACVTLTGCEEKFNEWSTKTPASCVEKGVETRTGNKGSVETRYIDSKGHSFGEWSIETPASCIAKGTEKRVCSVCNHVETRDIEMVDHTYLHIDKVPATETETGVAEHYECSVCHKIFDMEKHETTATALVVPVIHFAGVAVDGDVQANLVRNTETGLYEGKFTMSELYSRVKFVLVYDDGSKAPLTVSRTVVEGNAIIVDKVQNAPWTYELYFDTEEMAAKGEFCYSLDTATQYTVSYDLAHNKLIVNAVDPRSIEGLTLTKVEVAEDAQVELTKNAETGIFSGKFQLNHVYDKVRFIATYTAADGKVYKVEFKYANTTFTGNGVKAAKVASAPWTAELYSESDNGQFFYSRGSEAAPVSDQWTIEFNPTTNTVTINVIDPTTIQGLTLVGMRIVDDATATLTKDATTGIYSGEFQLNAVWKHVRVVADLEDVDHHKFVGVISYDNATVKGNGVLAQKGSAPSTAELYTEADNFAGEFWYSIGRSTRYAVSYDPAKNELTINVVDARDIEGLTLTSVEVIGSANVAFTKKSDKVYEGEFTLHTLWNSVRFIARFTDAEEHNYLSIFTYADTTFVGNGIMSAQAKTAPWNERLFAEEDAAVAKGQFSYSLSRSTKYAVSYDVEAKKVTVNVVDARDIEGLTFQSVEVAGAASKVLEEQASGKFEGLFALNKVWSSVKFIVKFKDADGHNYLTIMRYVNNTFNGNGIASAPQGAQWNEVLYAEGLDAEDGNFVYSRGTNDSPILTEYYASYDPDTKTMSITAQPAITKVELKGYVEKELVLNTTTGKYEVEFVLDHQWGRVKFDVTKDNSTEPIRLTHNITQFKGTGIVPNKVEGSTDDERLYADSDEMFNNGEYCYALANGTKTYYKAVYDPKNNTLTIDVDLSKVTGVSVTGDAQTDLVLNTTTGKFEGQFSLSEAWKSVHFLMKFGEDARDILIKYTNSTVKGTGVLSAMSTTGSPNTVELFADTDNMVNAGTFMLSIGTEINYFVSFDPSTNVLMINVIPASMKVTTPNGNVDLVLNSETGLYEGEFTMPSGWPQASIVCVVNAQVDYKLKFSNTKYAGTGVVDHLAGCQWDSRLFCDNTDVADGNLCVNLSAEKTFTISYDVKAGIVTINFKA